MAMINSKKLKHTHTVKLYWGKMIRSKKAPKIYSVQLEKQKSNVLPAGRYFIGDPAYFLHDAIKFFDQGHYALPDGRGLILFKVAADSFITSEKQTYSIFSGWFGIISYDLGDKDKYTGDGTFHNFTSQVSMTFDKDKFNIKCDDFAIDLEQCEACFSDDEGYDSCG
jgi:hypothetical protein